MNQSDVHISQFSSTPSLKRKPIPNTFAPQHASSSVGEEDVPPQTLFFKKQKLITDSTAKQEDFLHRKQSLEQHLKHAPNPATPSIDLNSSAEQKKQYLENYPYNMLHQRYKRLIVKQKIIFQKEIRLQCLLDIFISDYETTNQNTIESVEYLVILKDDWKEQTEVEEGDVIHVIGTFDSNHICEITCKKHFIIVNPDYLFSVSHLSDGAARCHRLPFISEKISNFDLGANTTSATYGSILHSIFQIAMEHSNFTDEFLTHTAKRVMKQFTSLLFINGETEEQVMQKIQTYFPFFQQFATKALQTGMNISFFSKESIYKLTQVMDLEESIWSPMYGLSGKIDITAEFSIQEKNSTSKSIIPIELKSGKRFSERGNLGHRAQLLLYLLMISDKYDQKVVQSMLYYMGYDSPPIGVKFNYNEVRPLIILRNQVCHALTNAKALRLKKSSSFSPMIPLQPVKDIEDLMYDSVHFDPIILQFSKPIPMVKEAITCNRCFKKFECMTFHKSVESGTVESSGLGETFANATEHVTSKHAEYVSTWIKLIDLECLEGFQFRKEIWYLTGPQREAMGRCLCSLIFTHEEKLADGNYRYELTKFYMESEMDFRKTDMDIGSYILMSTELGHTKVASGTIIDLTRHSVTVIVSNRLHLPFFTHQTNHPLPSIILWRMDVDEFSGAWNTARSNVLQLLVPSVLDPFQRISNLRQWIIEEMEPQFSILPNHSIQLQQQFPWFSSMDKDQQHALQKVLTCKQYALILGMPGSGKTSTIARVIQALVCLKKKVLITAYTHTAVDTILVKLKELQVSFLRLGKIHQIHPLIQPFCFSTMIQNPSSSSIRELTQQYQVIGVTSLGIHDPILQTFQFDYCIVDEAGQITEPVVLGPLFLADKFVMVGDSFQLPPLVSSDRAKHYGMQQSLFQKLCEKFSHCVAYLRFQYRMNQSIMKLANEIVYQNQLQCANETVAKAILQAPNWEWFTNAVVLPNWIHFTLHPQQSVLFVNTDTVSFARETILGKNLFNELELQLCIVLCHGLVLSGVKEEEIGIICPFRVQATMLRKALTATAPLIQIQTIDKYQGTDKQVIIISTVRSNLQCQISDIMKDVKRLNVAFTRAKHKLLLVGSLSTYLPHAPMNQFLQILEKDKQIFSLPTFTMDDLKQYITCTTEALQWDEVVKRQKWNEKTTTNEANKEENQEFEQIDEDTFFKTRKKRSRVAMGKSIFGLLAKPTKNPLVQKNTSTEEAKTNYLEALLQFRGGIKKNV